MNKFLCLLAVGLTLGLQCQVDAKRHLSRSFIEKCVKKAKTNVDDAYTYSRQVSLDRVRRNAASPADILRMLKQPNGPSRQAVRAADYMANTLHVINHYLSKRHKRSINATDLISKGDLDVIANLTGCAAQVRNIYCRDLPNINKYRTANSICNNLWITKNTTAANIIQNNFDNPRWGASNIPFLRWLPAEYEDRISSPKGWTHDVKVNDHLLPLVRDVSNRILATANSDVENDPLYTHLVTIFGQWTDHDITFTPHSPSIRSFNDGIDCEKTCGNTEPCFPIEFPSGDPRIRDDSEECMPFSRSAPACGSGNTGHIFGSPTVRQQMNTLTAFIDVGQVYGSDDSKARSLRNLTTDQGLPHPNVSIVSSGGLDPILRGLIGRPAKLNTQDHMLTDELRDRLFKFSVKLALDLGSLNLQRGRDHGLPGYNKWREFCGLSQPRTLSELAEVLNNTDLAQGLLDLYGTPDNIDPWLAGVAEPFVSGGRVGPLFACLIATQFQNIREGDRFWWENEGVFTAAQRLAIRDTSLARIICDNTGITEVPEKPFQYRPRGSGYTQCDDIPAFDLSPWKEGPAGPRGPPGPPGPPGPSGAAEHVAFSVRLGNNFPKAGAPIAFHDVIYNGQSSYDPKTGFFTCEHPGVYEFEFHCIIYQNEASVDLLHNGKLILHSFTTRQSGYITASGSTFIKLAKGDRVWLIANHGGNGLTSDSFFSGHLLFTE
uniref:Eosinophil peroxidase-like n=1 Tax=Poecilia latipinna TaxID=48699 RepID=A0A3B3UI96_9TELE